MQGALETASKDLAQAKETMAQMQQRIEILEKGRKALEEERSRQQNHADVQDKPLGVITATTAQSGNDSNGVASSNDSVGASGPGDKNAASQEVESLRQANKQHVLVSHFPCQHRISNSPCPSLLLLLLLF